MDLHERAPYVPLPERKPLRWPGGARLAVWISPNVEWWPSDAMGAPATQASTANLKPDVLNAAWREYGARVGFWRMTDIMDRLEIRCSVNLNSLVCEHYPQLVEAGVQRNWEFLGHGLHNGTLHTDMAEDEERQRIETVYHTIAKATGKPPAGWLGPALTETAVTPDLLAECGYKYVADWCDDDQPHPLRTRSGKPLLSVPYSIEVNDYPAFLNRAMTGAEFGQMITDQFDWLYDEAGRIGTGLVMCVALHPFLVGQPFRALHLESALRHMRQREEVWWTTGAEIADWYNDHNLNGV